MKEKTYIVVVQEQEDEGSVIRMMTAEQIRELYTETTYFAIIDGEVLKDTGNKRLPREVYK